MKKVLAIALCLVVVLGLFAGCNKPTENAKNQVRVDEFGRQIITIGIPQKTTVQDYNTNAYTLWLEEVSDYNIEWVLYSSSAGDYKTQLATALINQSEPLPDILFGFKGLGDGVWSQYGEDEYFIDLTDYMMDKEGKAKVWWDRAAELDPDYVDHIIKSATGDNGRIYAFPRVEETVIDTMNSMGYINQEWLKKLNLEMPTDPESLYNVLKAFRDQDPDGNGKNDQIPMVCGGPNTGTGTGDGISWIINMFLYFDQGEYFALSEDGQNVTIPFTSDKFREALIFCRKLYDEGLIHPSVFTISTEEMKSLLNPAEGECKVGIGFGHPTLLMEYGHDSVYNWIPLEYHGCVVRNMNQNTYDTFITEDAADVDACWDLLMIMCSEESAIRQRYGAEGINWVKADEGAKSFLGLDAKIKLLKDPFGAIGNECLNNVSATILRGAENEYVQVDESDKWQVAKMNLLKGIYENYVKAEQNNNPKYLIPSIIYDKEEDLLTEDERSNVKSFFKMYRMAFIIGSDGLDPTKDDHWEFYISELEANGLNTWYEQVSRLYVEDGYRDKVLANAG